MSERASRRRSGQASRTAGGPGGKRLAARGLRGSALPALPSVLLSALLAVLTAIGAALPARGADATPPIAPSGPLHVAVSVPPQAYFVERIGGARVATTVLVPAGSEPHAYEPTPRQAAAVLDADLYVEVGHPSFTFEPRFIARLLAERPGLPVVDMSEGIRFLGAEPGRPASGDPHVWVAPETVRLAAANIAAALVRLEPGSAPAFEANLAALLADVDRVDGRLRQVAAGAKRKVFFVYHPAWGYLAHEYGLEQVAVELDGKEPTPRRLVELTDRARALGVKVIFVQQGFSEQGARALAQQIGARVVPLDPMARDWTANLLHVADELAEALGDG